MTHIAYLIPLAEYGGTQTHVRDLVQEFRRDREVTLLVGSEGYLTDQARLAGANVQVLNSIRRNVSPQDVKAYSEIKRVLAGNHVDVLHAHNSKAGLLGRLAASRQGVPAIYTAHGWAFAEGVPRLQKMQSLVAERWMAPRSAKIITVSEADRRLALRNKVGTPEQLVAIHNGIPDNTLRASPGSGTGLRLLMVGRFATQKDQLTLAKAACALPELEELVFIGDGPLLDSTRHELQRLPGAGRIQIHSNVESVDPFLARCNVFCLSSRWEGLPISILEAMRAGLPVVASDVGGVSEAVADGRTGFVVPSGDVESMKRALQKLADGSQRAAMGAAGRKSYETGFTLDRQMRQTRAVVEEVERGSRSEVKRR